MLYNGVRGNLKNVWKAFCKKGGKFVALAAVIGGPIGMTGYVMAINYMGASIGAVASAIFPAIGSILAYFFLKEKMQWYRWIFLIATLLGVYGLSYSPDLNITNFWLGIIGAMMCAFGTDIIRVIFESGSFTAESTEMTGSIFARYALGMSAFAVLDLLNKAYYAMKKTLVPLLINLGVLALNIVLNRVFRTDTGVAAATSIALTIGALAMIAQLFRGTGIVRLMPLLKGLAATAAMSLVLYGGHALLVTADESKLMLVVKCGLTGVAGCAVYLGVSLLLRQTIMAETIRKFKK